MSRWLLDALSPLPGEHILELAAGVGETGLVAAARVAPSGSVVISDQADAMLAAARERAAELGITNVEFRQLNAEWIDMTTASVDGVLCRWGYMLMVDPETALRETRRVLKPGGRVALATWDKIDANPWFALPARELVERGIITPPAPSDAHVPGPFAISDTAQLTDLLHRTGFTEVRVEAVALQRRHSDFSDFWESTLDFSAGFHDAVMNVPRQRSPHCAIRSPPASRRSPRTTADSSSPAGPSWLSRRPSDAADIG